MIKADRAVTKYSTLPQTCEMSVLKNRDTQAE